ncbi:tyrosine-type recombinase/integrase [Lonsdalea quercina]|uniref:tyrosine-type recombinase/integrase n=1 Tax=Lonsdalea quercina TaxID=71657 RepID=UPI003976D6F9
MLTDSKVRSAKPLAKSYKLTDSQGLYLTVSTSGAKLWYFRYRLGGKENRPAFGPYPQTTLAEAREKRDAARKLLASGISLSQLRKLNNPAVEESRTFQYIATTWHICCLKLWSDVHADKILTCLKRLPELLAKMENYKGRMLTRLALELNLHVFLRSSELRFARWDEFNFKAHIWSEPAQREAVNGVRFSERGAKMKDEHLVPLSRQAVDLLKQMQAYSGELVFVFPGAHTLNKPMSENTINKALRVIGYDTKTEVCGHGFRTMACSALNESGCWSKDAIERQMSHKERNGMRATYVHKAEHLEARIEMMQWWSDYLDVNREGYVAPYIYARSYKRED